MNPVVCLWLILKLALVEPELIALYVPETHPSHFLIPPRKLKMGKWKVLSIVCLNIKARTEHTWKTSWLWLKKLEVGGRGRSILRHWVRAVYLAATPHRRILPELTQKVLGYDLLKEINSFTDRLRKKSTTLYKWISHVLSCWLWKAMVTWASSVEKLFILLKSFMPQIMFLG